MDGSSSPTPPVDWSGNLTPIRMNPTKVPHYIYGLGDYQLKCSKQRNGAKTGRDRR